MAEIIDEILNPGYGVTLPESFTTYDTDPLLRFDLSGVFFDGGSYPLDDESICLDIQAWIKYGLPAIDAGTLATMTNHSKDNMVRLTTSITTQTTVDVPVLNKEYRGSNPSSYTEHSVDMDSKLFIGIIPIANVESVSLLTDGVVTDTWDGDLETDKENLIYFDIAQASYSALEVRFGLSGLCDLVISSMELRRNL